MSVLGMAFLLWMFLVVGLISAGIGLVLYLSLRDSLGAGYSALVGFLVPFACVSLRIRFLRHRTRFLLHG